MVQIECHTCAYRIDVSGYGGHKILPQLIIVGSMDGATS